LTQTFKETPAEGTHRCNVLYLPWPCSVTSCNEDAHTCTAGLPIHRKNCT